MFFQNCEKLVKMSLILRKISSCYFFNKEFFKMLNKQERIKYITIEELEKGKTTRKVYL